MARKVSSSPGLAALTGEKLAEYVREAPHSEILAYPTEYLALLIHRSATVREGTVFRLCRSDTALGHLVARVGIADEQESVRINAIDFLENFRTSIGSFCLI